LVLTQGPFAWLPILRSFALHLASLFSFQGSFTSPLAADPFTVPSPYRNRFPVSTTVSPVTSGEGTRSTDLSARSSFRKLPITFCRRQPPAPISGGLRCPASLAVPVSVRIGPLVRRDDHLIGSTLPSTGRSWRSLLPEGRKHQHYPRGSATASPFAQHSPRSPRRQPPGRGPRRFCTASRPPSGRAPSVLAIALPWQPGSGRWATPGPWRPQPGIHQGRWPAAWVLVLAGAGTKGRGRGADAPASGTRWWMLT
jgi:hypothetical protein